LITLCPSFFPFPTLSSLSLPLSLPSPPPALPSCPPLHLSVPPPPPPPLSQIKLGNIISEAKGKVDEVRDQYDLLAAEDKELDRTFRKDFADCEPYVDQLYKLFRKRPRGQKHKTMVESVAGNPSLKSQDLFSVRPSSSGAVREGENPMTEMDNVVHMPEGMEMSVWERFIAHRHRKVESESKVCVPLCIVS
jgi:hypothetical protein